MKTFFKSALILLIGFTITACNSKNVQSAKKSSADIVIKDAWARTANKGANSAVYFTIVNNTNRADTLTGIQTAVAEMAGVHKTFHNQGMTGMKEVETPVIEPNSKFVLKPGGYHVMLMTLNRNLAENDSIQLTLNFAVSETKKITVPVGKK